jgi:pyrroloquinoline quinone biosynthesis protein B
VSLSRRDFLTALGAVALAPRPTRLLASRLKGSGEPYALVLGTIQDGGIPQVGCYTPRCERARRDPRNVASLALVHPDQRRYYLVDATPDIARQLDLIEDADFRRRAADRRPFDGIFLTHAHIGHYVGLAQLGREGLGMRRTPVYCTPVMAEYLSTNGPWSLLVEEGRIYFPEVPVGEWFKVDEWLSVRMIRVPHRPEFSDTVGFVFRGTGSSLLYVPDIDRWEAWKHSLVGMVGEVDAALLDGSFYAASEVPGRAIEDIPHPLVPHTMDLLEESARAGARVIFTHFNNTNPVLDEGVEAAEVRRRGFELAREGMRLRL